MDDNSDHGVFMTRSQISTMLPEIDDTPLLIVLLSSEDTTEPVTIDARRKEFGLEDTRSSVRK